MLVGTMFTLLVLPSVYMVLASNHSPDELDDQTDNDNNTATPKAERQTT
jgi:multidrug efflux pump